MRKKTEYKETGRQGEMAHELSAHLDHWVRWYRLRRAAAWAVRGLAIGLVIGLFVSMAAILRGLLLRQEFLTFLLSISAGGILLAAGVAFAWPISRLWAARYFDLRFGLQERISTALEWAEKSDLPREREELRSKQHADALAAARRVDVQARLPLHIAWQEILLVLLLVGAAALASFWGRPYFQAIQETRLVQGAIAKEKSRIEAVLEEIHSASELSPKKKDALAAPLEEARRQLEKAQTLE